MLVALQVPPCASTKAMYVHSPYPKLAPNVPLSHEIFWLWHDNIFYIFFAPPYISVVRATSVVCHPTLLYTSTTPLILLLTTVRLLLGEPCPVLVRWHAASDWCQRTSNILLSAVHLCPPSLCLCIHICLCLRICICICPMSSIMAPPYVHSCLCIHITSPPRPSRGSN